MTTDAIDAGQRYAAARASIVALVGGLAPEQLATPVPTCPGWTVHDVVAHLAGLATDAVNGVGAGDDIDGWTARQVGDRRGATLDELLAEWESASTAVEAQLAAGEMRLPAAVLDAVTHEHDIRGALGLPGNRDEPTLLLASRMFTGLWTSNLERAGLAALRVAAEANGDEPHIRASEFEVFRVAFGRRSRAQIAAMIGGVGDAEPYVDLLCVFGPSAVDIVE